MAKAKITVMQVVPRLNSGGSEQATVEITDALVRAGARALVVTRGGRMVDAVLKSGGEIVDLPVTSKNPLTVLANAQRMARLIEAEGIDLVHARSRAPGWSALMAARRTGRPFVTTYHGAYAESGPVKALYNSVMGRGDRVIANSAYTAGVIVARHSGAQERVRIIYRGIGPSQFDPARVSPERVARLREAWNVPPGAKIVLHAARLTGIKGQRETVEAAAKLKARGALGDAVFILAGGADNKGSYRDELAGRIAALGLQDQVKLVGHCTDMPAAFLASHVALMPSRVPETFGRASAEAEAMGCPVIASRLGALPETMIAADENPAGYTGWLVPPENADALTEAIGATLALAPGERAAIGARARVYATERFSLFSMQRQTLAVYDELLGTDLAGRFERETSQAAAKV